MCCFYVEVELVDDYYNRYDDGSNDDCCYGLSIDCRELCWSCVKIFAHIGPHVALLLCGLSHRR